jgi:hypothetical protein
VLRQASSRLVAKVIELNKRSGLKKEPNGVQWFEWGKQGQCTQVTVGYKGVLCVGALALAAIYAY